MAVPIMKFKMAATAGLSLTPYGKNVSLKPLVIDKVLYMPEMMATTAGHN